MLELGYSGPSGSAFGTKAGVDPEENKKEPVLWAGAPAGTTGAGKAAGSGAWDILEVETGGGSRDRSEGQEAADTGLGLKKSRSDDGLFCTTEISGEQRPRRDHRRDELTTRQALRRCPAGPTQLDVREEPLEVACPGSRRPY